MRRGYWVSQVLGLIAAVGLVGCGQSPSTTPRTGPLVSGLSAHYQGTGNMSWQKVDQTDNTLAFDWGTLPPVEGMSPGGFEASWSGNLVAPTSGLYTLSLEGLGSAQLSVSGKSLSLGQSGQVQLEAGVPYDLSLNYAKTGPEAALMVRWNLAGKDAEVVSPAALFHQQNASSNVVASQAVTQGTNLLRNGNFEAGTGMWPRYSGTRSLVSPGRANSKYALSLSNFAWVQQDLPAASIQGGLTYTLKLWGKAAANQTCTAGLAYGGASSKQLSLNFSGDWSQKTLEITLPSGTQWVAVYLTSPAGQCTYDDAELIAGIATPPPPAASRAAWAVNGTFDYGTQGWNIPSGQASVGKSIAGFATDPVLHLEKYTWAQQNLDLSLVQPGDKVRISVEMAALLSGQKCKVDLAVGKTDGTSEVLTANAYLYTDFVPIPPTSPAYTITRINGQVFTLPSNLAWAAVYFSSENGGCEYDNLKLELLTQGDWVHLPGNTPNMFNFSIGVDLNAAPVVAGTTTTASGIQAFTATRPQSLSVYRWDSTGPVKLGDLTAVRPLNVVNLSTPAIAFDPIGNPIVAFTETQLDANGSPTSSQVLVYRYTGSQWNQIGSALPASVGKPSLIQADATQVMLAYVNPSGAVTIQGNSGTDWTSLFTSPETTASTPILRRARNGDPTLMYGAGGQTLFYQRERRTLVWNPLTSAAGYPAAFEFDSQSRPILAGSGSSSGLLDISVLGVGKLGSKQFAPTGFAMTTLGDQVVANNNLEFSRWDGAAWQPMPSITMVGTRGNAIAVGGDGVLYAAMAITGSGMSPVSLVVVYTFKL